MGEVGRGDRKAGGGGGSRGRRGERRGGGVRERLVPFPCS